MLRKTRRWRVLGASAITAGLVAAALGVTQVPSTAATSKVPANRFAGVNITFYRGQPRPTSADYARLAKDGMNTVSVEVPWDADLATQSQLTPDQPTLDSDLQSAIAGAKAAHLKIAVNPFVLCGSCPGQWRGAINPTNRAAFYSSYTSMITHLADIAQRQGADDLFIGSEMDSMQGDSTQWHDVARQARAHYTGKLIYGANWTNASWVPFWDAVDIAGISAYMPLSPLERPTTADLYSAWHTASPTTMNLVWYTQLAALSQLIGKPLAFTEAGYRSTTYAAKNPGDYTTVYPTDNGVQAAAYQALLQTFNSATWWGGVLWWDWHAPVASGDTSFTPENKPAESVLSAAYTGH